MEQINKLTFIRQMFYIISAIDSIKITALFNFRVDLIAGRYLKPPCCIVVSLPIKAK